MEGDSNKQPGYSKLGAIFAFVYMRAFVQGILKKKVTHTRPTNNNSRIDERKGRINWKNFMAVKINNEKVVKFLKK